MIEGNKIINKQVAPRDQVNLTTHYTEKAVDFINRNKANRFFLYVAHSMPHVPLFVSDKFKGKSKQGFYGDVIMEIDWSVGEILGALDKNGLATKTLVIFTSDNGPWLSYGHHAGNAGPSAKAKRPLGKVDNGSPSSPDGSANSRQEESARRPPSTSISFPPSPA
jgi:arylsulfatase